MEKERIKEAYLDLKQPGSFGGIRRFYLAYKKAHPDSEVSFRKVKEYVEEIPLYQIHVERKEKILRRKIGIPPGSQSNYL